MGESLWYDLGIGTVTGVISTVVVTIVWKCIKAMLTRWNWPPGKLITSNLSNSPTSQEGIEPSNPSNSPTSQENKEHVIRIITPSNSPTSSPDRSPPASPTPSFGAVASIPPSHGQEGIEPCVIDNKLSPSHGQEGIEPCVIDNKSSSSPASPTPSFGPVAIIPPLQTSSPPASPTPSFGPVAIIPPLHGQEGIEPCVIDNTSGSPPPSPTPSFGLDVSSPPRTGRERNKILNDFAKGIDDFAKGIDDFAKDIGRPISRTTRQVKLKSIKIVKGIRHRLSKSHVE